MKGKLMALFVVALLATAGCGASAAPAPAPGLAEADEGVGVDFGGLEAEADYGPEEGYDEYALTEYTIEDAGATFVATVSRKADGSAYFVHCDYFGDEQAVELDGDLNVTYDNTGFLLDDAPMIVQKSINEGKWLPVN